MKKLLFSLLTLTLFTVACNRDHNADVQQREDSYNTDVSTGASSDSEDMDETDNSELGGSMNGTGAAAPSGQIQREEEDTGSDIRMNEGTSSDIGTGTGSDSSAAGSSDAAGMGMDE